MRVTEGAPGSVRLPKGVGSTVILVEGGVTEMGGGT